jgi:hypothetical protein
MPKEPLTAYLVKLTEASEVVERLRVHLARQMRPDHPELVNWLDVEKADQAGESLRAVARTLGVDVP